MGKGLPGQSATHLTQNQLCVMIETLDTFSYKFYKDMKPLCEQQWRYSSFSCIFCQILLQYFISHSNVKLFLFSIWDYNCFFFFNLCFGHTSRYVGVLVPQSEIKLMIPILEAWSLNRWFTREVLQFFNFCSILMVNVWLLGI